MTFDDAGNLTNDGIFAYEWDAADRLVRVSGGEYGITNPVQKEFRYDHLSRRVEEKCWRFVGGYWVLQYKRRFLYHGHNMVAELDTTGAASTVRRSFVWGPDVSGGNAAGGVGGLLLIRDQSDPQNVREYFPGYEGRGNVTLLVDARVGTVSAALEYSVWGDVVRATGDWERAPFLYGTKWSLDQGLANGSHWPIGLYDYGFRLYNPKLGRFISRDPIGHAGGMNLYQAFNGDPVNNIDVLGLQPSLPRLSIDWLDETVELPPFTVISPPWDGNPQGWLIYDLGPGGFDHGRVLGSVSDDGNSVNDAEDQAQGEKWTPNKADCDALRERYPAAFKDHTHTFTSLNDAVIAGTIQAGVVQAEKRTETGFYEAGTFFYVSQDGGFGFTEPKSVYDMFRDWATLPPRIFTEGERVVGYGHSHNVTAEASARHHGVSVEEASSWHATGSRELFLSGDMDITTLGSKFGSPTLTIWVSVHTPENDLRIWSQRRHGRPTNGTHPGDRLPNAPSKYDTGRIIQCIRNGY